MAHDLYSILFEKVYRDSLYHMNTQWLSRHPIKFYHI